MQTVKDSIYTILQHLTSKKDVHSFDIHKSYIILTNWCDLF